MALANETFQPSWTERPVALAAFCFYCSKEIWKSDGDGIEGLWKFEEAVSMAAFQNSTTHLHGFHHFSIPFWYDKSTRRDKLALYQTRRKLL